MKIEIYQIDKVPPLTVVECDDWYLNYEDPGELVLLKDDKPIAFFFLKNIAGFKVISEDGEETKAKVLQYYKREEELYNIRIQKRKEAFELLAEYFGHLWW